MSVTRRELCAMLPAVLIPATLPSEATAAEDNVLPSAMYPFEKLTPRTSNSATIRDSPQRQARHGLNPWKFTRPLCFRAELPTRRSAISIVKCG